MRKFWQRIKIMNPFILLVCMLLVIFIYVNFNYEHDIERLGTIHQENVQQVDSIKASTFNQAVAEDISSNSSKLKLVVEYMVDKIHASYEGEYKVLKQDFENPDSDKALYTILDEGIKRLNLKDETDTKYIITSRYSILTKYKTTTSAGTTDNDSIQLLSYVESNYKLMMDRNTSSVIIDTRSGKMVNTEEVSKAYVRGDSLGHYYQLVPSYVTSEGDIFGTPDFDSIGEPQKNYRLMVIKVTKMSDIADDLKIVDKELHWMYNILNREYADARVSELERRFISSIILLLATIGILFYTQYYKYYKITTAEMGNSKTQ